jgi:hypothetical protein
VISGPKTCEWWNVCKSNTIIWICFSRIYSCHHRSRYMTYLHSDSFFLGLFGYGVSTEITVKMTHPLQSCTYTTLNFTVNCAMGSTVATFPSGKSLTRSKKVCVLKHIIRNKEWIRKIEKWTNSRRKCPGLCPILGIVRENPGRMVTLSSCTQHLVGFRAGWHRSSKRRYLISGNLYIRDRRNKAFVFF